MTVRGRIRKKVLPSKCAMPISGVAVTHEINPPAIKSSSQWHYSSGEPWLQPWMVSRKGSVPSRERAKP